MSTSEFTSSIRLGLVFIFYAGSISLLCVSGIIAYTAIKRSQGRRYKSDVSDSDLFLTLMVAEFIYSIGAIFNLRWAVEGTITEGPFCMAQGFLKQIGNNGISFTSLAITIHTFLVLGFHRNPGKRALVSVIVVIIVCTLLVVVVPNILHRHDLYYANTGFWCFINSKYTTERLVTEYVWVWWTGLVMVILYPILAIMVCIWGWSNDRASHVTVAKKLLLYPVAYNLAILPNSVVRWLSFTDRGPTVPDGVILAASVLHALSGFFNFVVFGVTRPEMVFGRSHIRLPNAPSPRSSQKDSPASSVYL